MATESPRRILLVAIGEAGHAFPIIAIGRELRARGHTVAIHTWFRWQEHIENADIEFFRAPKFEVAPDERVPNVHEAAALAADELAGVVKQWRPDVVVGDVLTLSASLAAEICEVPYVTFVPHFWHATSADDVPFGSGWSPSNTAFGRSVFRFMHRFERKGLEFGRDELNETRSEVGLESIDQVHGAISRELVLVGTLPQLEPQRVWPENVKVVGPVMWEPPAQSVTVPQGEDPLVVVAPSTAQDLDHTMLGAAVSGLRDRPVRVMAAKNGREPARKLKPGENTTIVDWAPYSQIFPPADVVICHGGHGTVMRALTSGASVVICPASGDQYENAARVRWAGVGVAVPHRFISSKNISAAVDKVLANGSYARKALELAHWNGDRESRGHGGAALAADAIEAHAAVQTQ
ncbi:MAG: glycosyltransferase [Solirubrobacterales bacterium]